MWQVECQEVTATLRENTDSMIWACAHRSKLHVDIYKRFFKNEWKKNFAKSCKEINPVEDTLKAA